MASAIENATFARNILYHQENIKQAERNISKWSHLPAMQAQERGTIAREQAAIDELRRQLAGMGAAQQEGIEDKLATLELQKAGVLKGPTSNIQTTTTTKQEVSPMPLPAIPGFSSFQPMFAAMSAAKIANNPLVGSVGAPQTAASGLGDFFSKWGPTILAGVGGLAVGGIGGYVAGKSTASRSINPRTGKPYRRMDTGNIKALRRSVRRVKGFGKLTKSVEKDIKAAARSVS